MYETEWNSVLTIEYTIWFRFIHLIAYSIDETCLLLKVMVNWQQKQCYT